MINDNEKFIKIALREIKKLSDRLDYIHMYYVDTKEWTDEISQVRKSASLDISTYSEATIPDVVFDPDHLKQIVTNLLLNAIQAMEAKGQLKIHLSEDQNMVRIAISDTGPGISDQDQAKIFRIFYSTKPGGTGLGLPLTRRLLELNNGTIEFNSNEGQGCTVIIRLPAWSDSV